MSNKFKSDTLVRASNMARKQLEDLKATGGTNDKLSFSERLLRCTELVPDDAWEDVPEDLSEKLDTCLYNLEEWIDKLEEE